VHGVIPNIIKKTGAIRLLFLHRVDKTIVGAGAFDSPLVVVTDSSEKAKITRFYRRGVEGAAPYTLKYRLF
jgi:hypothetical protein